MIKNIIFDIGNVLVKWDPTSVVKKVFPDHEDYVGLTAQLFKVPAWYDINRGKISAAELIQIYHQTLGIELDRLNRLLVELKESLVPIENSFDLLTKAHQARYQLYALTDNVHEIMQYLKNRYDFWNKFNGIVMSAEVGHLKPSPEIYQYLLRKYPLKPNETLFIDDIKENVEGAKLMGMHGIQFQNTAQCLGEMKKLQIIL